MLNKPKFVPLVPYLTEKQMRDALAALRNAAPPLPLSQRRSK